MYPNASECVKTGPNRPENVEKLRENVEKLREGLYYLKFRILVTETPFSKPLKGRLKAALKDPLKAA